MREKNRIPIASHRKLPQFTTMNVIDGQAGLVIYSSLIFYSLTIDNILNIVVLLILAGVTVATLTGDNGLLQKAEKAKNTTIEKEGLERIQLAVMASRDENGINTTVLAKNLSEINGLTDINDLEITGITLPQNIKLNNFKYKIKEDGTVENVDDLNLIEFSLTDPVCIYYAENGMTWYEWCTSEYNTLSGDSRLKCLGVNEDVTSQNNYTYIGTDLEGKVCGGDIIKENCCYTYYTYSGRR